MKAHDETVEASMIVHDLARGHAQTDRDQDQDQGSGPTALSPNETEVPSSFPRCETLPSSPNFEELARDLQEQNNELARDRDLADREVRRLRKEADLLRRELTEVREKDPKSQMIREVLDYWVKALGKSSRTKCPANGARWNKVRARLGEGFTVDQLKAAIEGCAKMPFVGPKGRQAIEGAGVKRFDDIELICRDETSVERFISYGKPSPEAPHLQVVPQPVLSGPLERVLSRLQTFTADGTDRFVARCPACDKRDGSLCVRLVTTENGEYVMLDCYVGCSEDRVLEKLGIGAADLVSTEGVTRLSWRPLPEHLRVAMRMLLSDGELEVAA